MAKAWKSYRILHVCGGDPDENTHRVQYLKYSPRVWRWSLSSTSKSWHVWVFSTCVEVIPVLLVAEMFHVGILHVCGGDPNSRWLGYLWSWYSPRVWRWSRCYLSQRCFMLVFSTCVEVILIGRIQGFVHVGILHVCGGDPICFTWSNRANQYSPRVWRWSYVGISKKRFLGVFSTCVEVILVQIVTSINTNGILHVCGGDPDTDTTAGGFAGYSPRVWRWSYQ